MAAESAKILEAEKMRRIYQDELEHAEKELQEVREEAERQKVGVTEVNPVAELEACPSTIGSVAGFPSRPRSSLWTQRETPMFVGTRASGDPAHAHSGTRRVECVVVRTPFRSPRRTHQRRPFGGNDWQDVAIIFTVIGTCRRVSRWGLRGVRIGEASNPGREQATPTQRLRALQRSMDSNSEDDRPLVSTSCPEVFAMMLKTHWRMTQRQALTNHFPKLLVEGDQRCCHNRLEAPRDPCVTDPLMRGLLRFVSHRMSDPQLFHTIASLHWTAKRQRTRECGEFERFSGS